MTNWRSMTLWVRAMWLVTSQNNDVSALGLQRVIPSARS
jgi:hypothetical protein